MRRIDGIPPPRVGGTVGVAGARPPPAADRPQDGPEIRGADPDQTFDDSTGEASALGWPGQRDGFPILLVLSDINCAELDDFRRTILVAGEPKFDGTVEPDGRHSRR